MRSARGRARFLRRIGAFVQRDQRVLPPVQKLRQPRGKAGRAAFGHARTRTRGAGQQAVAQHQPASASVAVRSRPPSSASSSIPGMQADHRQGQGGQVRRAAVADRAGAGAQPQPAKARRVNPQQPQRRYGAQIRGAAVRSGQHLGHDAGNAGARARLVQRIAAQAVRQGHGCHGSQMRAGDRRARFAAPPARGRCGAASTRRAGRQSRARCRAPRNRPEPRRAWQPAAGAARGEDLLCAASNPWRAMFS